MTAHYQWLWEHHARSWCWETLPLLHIREQQLTSLAWMSLHRFWLQLRVLILLAIPETYRGESNFGYVHHILCPWTQGLDLGLLSHGQVSSLKRSSANPLLSPHTCPWLLPVSSPWLAVPFYSVGSSSAYAVCTPSLNCVQLFVTLWSVAHQAPLSIGFFRQEYWSGLPFPPPGDLPDPGIKSESFVSPALQADSLPHWGSIYTVHTA